MYLRLGTVHYFKSMLPEYTKIFCFGPETSEINTVYVLRSPTYLIMVLDLLLG